MDAQHQVKARARFSSAQDIRIIYEVERRPILWDPTIEIYKRTDLKPPVWAQVAQHIGPEYTAEDVSGRFKNLKDTFMRNWRKVQESSKKCSGAGRDDIYRPKWSLYDSCQFLRKACAQGGSTSNFPESTSATNQITESAESSIVETEIEDTLQVYYDEQFMAIPSDESISESSSPAPSSLRFSSGPCSPEIMVPPRPSSAPVPPGPSTAAHSVKRPADGDQPLFSKKGCTKKSGALLMEEAVKVMKEISQQAPPFVEPVATIPKDREDALCAFIASRLRSMDEESKKKCENELLTVLMQY